MSSKERNNTNVLGTDEAHRKPRTLVTEITNSLHGLGEGDSERHLGPPSLGGPKSISVRQEMGARTHTA